MPSSVPTDVNQADGADEDEGADTPSKTREELEYEKNRTFLMALQELKNLRPQLYQAADYCEHQYLFGDNRQGVLDNIKDYSVKALVNAVDHLGTVAYKLNDLIALQQQEVEAVQLSASTIAQRLLACQEHSDREGLKQQSMAKSMSVHNRHYIVADLEYPIPKKASLLRETFDPSQPTPHVTRMQIPQAQSPQAQAPPSQVVEQLDASSGPEDWQFAIEHGSTLTDAPGRVRSTSVGKQPPPPSALSLSRGSFLNRTVNTSFKGAPTLAPSISMPAAVAAGPVKSQPTRAGSITPMRTAPVKTGNLDLERTMFLTPALPREDPKNAKGKGILRSFLGKRS